MKIKLDKIVEKRLTVARMRQLLNQLHSDEITFSRMVEILNDQTGSLLLKELTNSDIELLQKVANDYIIQGSDRKPFISTYGISQILNVYLNVLNK